MKNLMKPLAITLAMLCIVVAATITAQAQCTVTAYYPFTGNTNDASGNGYNATNNGATAVQDRNCAANGAYSFDGVNDEMTLGSGTGVGNFATGDFSISLWMNTTAGSGTQVALSKRQDCSPSTVSHWQLATINGVPAFSIRGPGPLAGTLSATTDISDGIWHHVAVTRNTSGTTTLRIYVDGQEENSSTDAYTAADPNTTGASSGMRIGNVLCSAFGGFWSGLLDEVRIYNTCALTDGDIEGQSEDIDGCHFPNFLVKSIGGCEETDCSVIYDDGANVGIGMTTPVHQFEVLNTTTEVSDPDVTTITVAGKFVADHPTNTNGQVGVLGEAKGSGENYGLAGVARESATENNGMQGYATGATTNVGVAARASGGTAYGGTFETTAGTTGYAAWFDATGASTNYAGWFENGDVIVNNGDVGIGVSSPAYQLHLSTDNAAKLSSNTWTVTSDARVKKDIAPFKDGLEVLMKIDPVTYYYNGLGGTEQATEKQNIGIIAQEIQKVAPYTVGTFKTKLRKEDIEETELLAFDAHALFFVLINSVKEQQQLIEDLQAQLNQICQEGCDKLNTNTINVSPNGSLNSDVFSVYPNPTDQKLNVKYDVRSGVAVQITLADASGKILKTYDPGNVNGIQAIDVSGLPASNYYITLSVDGNVVKSQTVSVIR